MLLFRSRDSRAVGARTSVEIRRRLTEKSLAGVIWARLLAEGRPVVSGVAEPEVADDQLRELSAGAIHVYLGADHFRKLVMRQRSPVDLEQLLSESLAEKQKRNEERYRWQDNRSPDVHLRLASASDGTRSVRVELPCGTATRAGAEVVGLLHSPDASSVPVVVGITHIPLFQGEVELDALADAEGAVCVHVFPRRSAELAINGERVEVGEVQDGSSIVVSDNAGTSATFTFQARRKPLVAVKTCGSVGQTEVSQEFECLGWRSTTGAMAFSCGSGYEADVEFDSVSVAEVNLATADDNVAVQVVAGQVFVNHGGTTQRLTAGERGFVSSSARLVIGELSVGVFCKDATLELQIEPCRVSRNNTILEPLDIAPWRRLHIEPNGAIDPDGFIRKDTAVGNPAAKQKGTGSR